MARNFLIRDEDTAVDAIIEAVASREVEIASYDANVAAYTQQLVQLDAALPAEWPESLRQYRGLPNEHIFAMGGDSEETMLASQLNHRERIRMLLFTEQAELKKSEAAYEQIKTGLPSDTVKLEAAIARHRLKVSKAVE